MSYGVSCLCYITRQAISRIKYRMFNVMLSVSCWISLETGLLWSFAGPVVIVCMVTEFFFRDK